MQNKEKENMDKKKPENRIDLIALVNELREQKKDADIKKKEDKEWQQRIENMLNPLEGGGIVMAIAEIKKDTISNTKKNKDLSKKMDEKMSFKFFWSMTGIITFFIAIFRLMGHWKDLLKI